MGSLVKCTVNFATKPGRLNPYVPNVDPTGLLIGPMALLVLARGRKGRKGDSKADFLIIAMVVLLAGGITLTACELPYDEPIPPITPTDPTILPPPQVLTTPGSIPTSPTETPSSPVTCPEDNQTLVSEDVIEELADYAFTNTTIAISGKAIREKVEDYLELIMLEAAENKLNTNELAYVYATTQLESRWADFVETYDGKSDYDYFEENYGYRSPAGKQLGNTEEGDGYNFRGRGFIHLTGRDNYKKVGHRLGINLIDNPDMAYYYEYIAQIAVIAMNEGLLTGAKLSEFNDGNTYDFQRARDIINSNPEPPLANDMGIRNALGTVSTKYAEILSKHCALCGLPSGIVCR